MGVGRPGFSHELMGPDRRRPGSQRVVSSQSHERMSRFNVDHPGGDGDFESLAAIRFITGRHACAWRPLALEARTTDWALPSDVGERVHLNPRAVFAGAQP